MGSGLLKRYYIAVHISFSNADPAKEPLLVSLIQSTHWRLAPGQSRPLIFHIGDPDPANAHFSFVINFIVGESTFLHSHVISSVITKRTILEPHKYTFLHPSGIVSYAILQAPKTSTMTSSSKLPILLNLHGAGLEADSDQVRHMLDSVTDIRAWTVFPTGVTPWSGDDWRRPTILTACYHAD